MKTAYKIVLAALAVLELAWFIPWLYFLAFPAAASDPFVAYSPVCDDFVITDNSGDTPVMRTLSGRSLTAEQRDSLLPQIFYNQLTARQQMPDSIKGVAMTLPNIRHGSWVFSSRPYDINSVQPRVHMMMESAPARFDLENPKVAFRLDGKTEFINMADNSINPDLSHRFTKAFADKGFTFPAKSLSANITTRKQYDEGYLMADARGDVYHVKMCASRPYVAKAEMPDSVEAAHVFILENMDKTCLGLIADTRGDVYALLRDGYKLAKLPLSGVDPTRDRIMVMADPFCWVVKTSNADGSRWTALSSSDFSLLGTYEHPRQPSTSEEVAKYLLPVRLSITTTDDPRASLRFKFPWN